MCTKNNNRDKLLLTSLADQVEKNRPGEKVGGSWKRGGKSYRTEDRRGKRKSV